MFFGWLCCWEVLHVWTAFFLFLASNFLTGFPVAFRIHTDFMGFPNGFPSFTSKYLPVIPVAFSGSSPCLLGFPLISWLRCNYLFSQWLFVVQEISWLPSTFQVSQWFPVFPVAFRSPLVSCLPCIYWFSTGCPSGFFASHYLSSGLLCRRVPGFPASQYLPGFPVTSWYSFGSLFLQWLTNPPVSGVPATFLGLTRLFLDFSVSACSVMSVSSLFYSVVCWLPQ